jgi:hypothetical protein
MNEFKRILYSNQIEYYKKYFSSKLNEELEFPISRELYNARIQRNKGVEFALTISMNDLYEKYNIFNSILKKTKNKTNDFWFYSGAINIFLLLMTVCENSLSACSKNKDLLLKNEITELENKLNDLLSKKSDTKPSDLMLKEINDIKNNLEIIKNLQKENLYNFYPKPSTIPKKTIVTEAKEKNELERLEKLLSDIEKKLNNFNFINKAKPDVIINERKKYEDVKNKIILLSEIKDITVNNINKRPFIGDFEDYESYCLAIKNYLSDKSFNYKIGDIYKNFDNSYVLIIKEFFTDDFRILTENIIDNKLKWFNIEDFEQYLKYNKLNLI